VSTPVRSLPTPLALRNYVIITPARDEAAYIQTTIESVVCQTILPLEWIIVNDGSRDATGTIIDDWSHRYSWLRAVHRPSRGDRRPGAGVVEAFYDGHNILKSRDWDFIVKLDADLSFGPTYFAQCFAQFETNSNLGIAGGTVYSFINHKELREKHPGFHVRGATKIYRKECWDAIGGLARHTGWDTLDEVKANMLGWETRTLPNLKVVQHRYTGAAIGTWGNLVKNGRANYICGYHPLFMFCKCLKRLFQKPYLIGSAGLLFGFASAFAQGTPQVDDKILINYLRRQQLKRLFFKSTIWK
jgi:biofilm PGA synthesis N-glycosyltransferase PgaC